MIGLEGKKIESAAKRILETLEGIRKSNEKFSQHMGVLTKHVTNAKNTADLVNNEYSKLSGQIEQVRLLKDNQFLIFNNKKMEEDILDEIYKGSFVKNGSDIVYKGKKG